MRASGRSVTLEIGGDADRRWRYRNLVVENGLGAVFWARTDVRGRLDLRDQPDGPLVVYAAVPTLGSLCHVLSTGEWRRFVTPLGSMSIPKKGDAAGVLRPPAEVRLPDPDSLGAAVVEKLR